MDRDLPAPATATTPTDEPDDFTINVVSALSGAAIAGIILLVVPGAQDFVAYLITEVAYYVHNMWAHIASLFSGYGWTIEEDSPFFNCVTMGNRICG
ncbi:MAG TPA: hypothetical protein VLN58_02035 [Verrucomicrobiae bacterium]|nr:hypothetical protein [Verrucomicrobiae bacterium]